MNGHAQPAAFGAQRKDQIFAHQVVGDEVDGIGRDRALIKIDEFHVVLSGQCLINRRIGAQLQVNQRLTHPKVLFFRVLQRPQNVFLRDGSPFHQQFAELLGLLCHRCISSSGKGKPSAAIFRAAKPQSHISIKRCQNQAGSTFKAGMVALP